MEIPQSGSINEAIKHKFQRAYESALHGCDSVGLIPSSFNPNLTYELTLVDPSDSFSNRFMLLKPSIDGKGVTYKAETNVGSVLVQETFQIVRIPKLAGDKRSFTDLPRSALREDAVEILSIDKHDSAWRLGPELDDGLLALPTDELAVEIADGVLVEKLPPWLPN